MNLASALRASLGVPYFSKILSGFDTPVSSVAFSDDGTFLAAGTEDRTIRVWDLRQPGTNPRILRTEVRATASAFCYHQGAIFGGFVPLVLTWFASHYELGFAIRMLVGTCVGGASFVIALLLGPETKGKVLMPDLVVA